ncbi:lysozyme inhibitor LprI family protein [Erythrobacter sp. R86502]|uniref:lysozyme inhibitor LprI family protein n=1 Tax=Erythrobacter sp. R86502 TaxID=3093846 RepID=UPI0036D2A0F6
MIASLVLPILLQSAEPPLPGWNCDDPMVQQEMNWCAGQDYAVADTELNAQWMITASIMKERDTGMEANFGPINPASPQEVATARLAYTGHFQTLLEAQRAWLTYRDAQCRLEGYSFLGGSAQPMIVAGCLAKITRQRTQELRDLVEVLG